MMPLFLHTLFSAVADRVSQRDSEGVRQRDRARSHQHSTEGVHTPPANRSNGSGGFSLMELAVSIGVIGILTGTALTVGLSKSTQESLVSGSHAKQAMDVVVKADDVVLGFAVRQYRLPCPDTNGDGLEDCNASPPIGQLPYLSLGLSQPVLDGAENPLLYGIYRNPNANATRDADLAVIKDRYQPLLPSVTGKTKTARMNRLDFCQALINANGAGTNITRLHTFEGNQVLHSAYVLISGGARDANDSGLARDGINEGPFNGNRRGLRVESPSRRNSKTYDDIVSAVSFGLLAHKLSCNEALMAVKSLAVATMAADNNHTAAENSLEQANVGAKGAKFGLESAISQVALVATETAIAAVDLALAIVNMWNGPAAGAAGLAAAVINMARVVAALVFSATAIKDATDAKKKADDAIAPAQAAVAAAKRQLDEIWQVTADMDRDGGPRQ